MIHRRTWFALGFTLIILAASILIACGGSSASPAPSTPAPKPLPVLSGANQIGTATATSVACPPSTANPSVSGTCMNVTIDCPGTATYPDAMIKISRPAGTSKGTVIYTTGGGNEKVYEENFIYGSDAINPVIAAGYTVVQTAFTTSAGWLDRTVNGVTGSQGGPLVAACRWATLAAWVYANVRSNNEAFCATGNSGGSVAIAYSLSRYGTDQLFNYVQPSGGPALSRIDYGCLCDPTLTLPTNCVGQIVDPCFGPQAAQLMDPSYGNNACSTMDASAVPTWQADSILSSDGKSKLNFNTHVHFMYGDMDTTLNPGLGMLWENAITSSHDVECVPGTPHMIADTMTGAQAVANAMTTNCH